MITVITRGLLAALMLAQAHAATLAWDSVPGAVSYRIYWNAQAARVGALKLSQMLDTGSTSAFIATPNAGWWYAFVVVAVSSTGKESAPSNVVDYIPTGSASNVPVIVSVTLSP